MPPRYSCGVVSSASALLNCIALTSGLIGISKMYFKENHLLFDWEKKDNIVNNN